MSRAGFRSQRAERMAMRAELIATGAAVSQIAATIRQRFGVNCRVAFRYACGLTQQNVVDKWNQLWPSDRPLTTAQISFWEVWPAPSGRPPSVEVLTRLARIYQCDVADLIDSRGSTADRESENSQPVIDGAPVGAHPHDDAKKVGGAHRNHQVGLEDAGAEHGLPAPSHIGNLEEVVGTNRRETLGALAANASSLAIHIRTGLAGSPRMELFTMKEVVADLAARYSTTPHQHMLPKVARHWHAAETILADGWRSDRYRSEFQVVAGQLAFLLSRLAFNMGDYPRSVQLLSLVEAHADAADDRPLGAAVSTMWSSLHFYQGDHRQALRTAREGHRFACRYHEAELYAYEARALGALGDPEALTVLDLMDEAPRPTGVAEPGGEPFTDEYGLLIRGGTFARLGRYRDALPITEASVARYEAQPNPPYESYGNACLAHARALLGVDVAEAATVTMRALDIIDTTPTHTVTQRARELAGLMSRNRNVGTVSELFERLASTPPPTSSVGGAW